MNTGSFNEIAARSVRSLNRTHSPIMQSHDVAATPPPALMHPPVFERIVNILKDSSALEPGLSSNLLGQVVAKSALRPRLKSKPGLGMGSPNVVCLRARRFGKPLVHRFGSPEALCPRQAITLSVRAPRLTFN